MNIKKICAYTVLLLAFSVFFSCTTTISVSRLMPAELDLEDAKTISVLPFQTKELGTVKATDFLGFFEVLMADTLDNPALPIAEYLTNNLQSRLIESGKYDVVNSSKIQQSLKAGNSTVADAYITGCVTNYKEEIIDTTNYNDTDPTPQFMKKVSMTVTYQIFESKTGKIKGFKVENFSKESFNFKTIKDLPDGATIMQNDMDKLIDSILHQIQPYYVKKVFKLLDVQKPSDDFINAKKASADKKFLAAQEQFEKIYDETGLFEAGYNAGILMQARGLLPESLAYMQNLYKKTEDERVTKAIQDIQKEINDSKRLEKQQTKFN